MRWVTTGILYCLGCVGCDSEAHRTTTFSEDDRPRAQSRPSTTSATASGGPTLTAPGLQRAPHRIGVSATHVCVIHENKTVWCWGMNADGQMGSGPSYSFHPIEVPALAGARDVVVGRGFTCALNESGALTCLGERSAALRLGSSSVQLADIAAAPSGPCALTTTGQIKCTADELSRKAPPGPVSLAAGDGFVCILLESGEVRCGGSNEAMNEAIGAPSSRGLHEVPRVAGVKRLGSSDSVACAIVSDGSVVCWGDVGAPAAIPGMTGAVELSVSGTVCATNATGEVQCARREGNGARAAWTLTTVQSVEGVTSFSALDDGYNRVGCGLVRGRDTICWGTDDNGLRGRGSNQIPAPVEVSGLPPMDTLALGFRLSCALTPQDAAHHKDMYCWGFQHRSSDVVAQVDRALVGTNILMWKDGAADPLVLSTQSRPGTKPKLQEGLGRAVSITDSEPAYVASESGLVFSVGAKQPVAKLKDVSSVSGSSDLVCALHKTGRVDCWVPKAGVLSTEPEDPSLVRLDAEDATELSVARNRACVVSKSRVAQCWSNIGKGRIVSGEPVMDARAIATALLGETCVVLVSGGIKCWNSERGCDRFGLLGRGDFPCQTADPASVVGIDDATEIAMTSDVACVLRRAGKVSCWGYNSDGAVGVPALSEADPPNVP
ncbi:MAG: hypothetical protein U0271_47080 [Polyangiaceae bacterium]